MIFQKVSSLRQERMVCSVFPISYGRGIGGDRLISFGTNSDAREAILDSIAQSWSDGIDGMAFKKVKTGELFQQITMTGVPWSGKEWKVAQERTHIDSWSVIEHNKALKLKKTEVKKLLAEICSRMVSKGWKLMTSVNINTTLDSLFFMNVPPSEVFCAKISDAFR
jgi:hypothetical protein